MKTKALLSLGLIVPLTFWATTIVCGILIDEYNHLTCLVSELGVLGSKTQYLFTTGLALSAILNVFFAIALWKICKSLKISVIPIVFLFLYSFIAGPAIFPMPLKLHGIVGMPFPFMMLSPVSAIVLWRKKEDLLNIRTIALISFVIMIFGFLIFFPNVLSEFFGLKQRFLYAGWTVWSVFLGFRFLKLYIVRQSTLVGS